MRNGRPPSKIGAYVRLGQLAGVFNAVSLIKLQLLHQAVMKCCVGPYAKCSSNKGRVMLPYN